MLPDLTIGKRHSDALRIPSNARLGNLATSNEQSRDTESWSPSMRCRVADECEEKKRKLDWSENFREDVETQCARIAACTAHCLEPLSGSCRVGWSLRTSGPLPLDPVKDSTKVDNSFFVSFCLLFNSDLVRGQKPCWKPQQIGPGQDDRRSIKLPPTDAPSRGAPANHGAWPHDQLPLTSCLADCGGSLTQQIIVNVVPRGGQSTDTKK